MGSSSLIEGRAQSVAFIMTVRDLTNFCTALRPIDVDSALRSKGGRQPRAGYDQQSAHMDWSDPKRVIVGSKMRYGIDLLVTQPFMNSSPLASLDHDVDLHYDLYLSHGLSSRE